MATLIAQTDTVAGRLRETRGAAGLTTRQIAAAVGVSPGTPSNWERGVGEPSATHLILWAQATGQHVGAMLDGIVASAPGANSSGAATDQKVGSSSLFGRTHCVETVDVLFWDIVGRQVIPDGLLSFSGSVP